jgi:hypothetical protein
LPCVMVTFRAIASLTKRSDSWRIASFDIAGARGFLTTNSPFSEEVSLYSTKSLPFSPAWVEPLRTAARRLRRRAV